MSDPVYVNWEGIAEFLGFPPTKEGIEMAKNIKLPPYDECRLSSSAPKIIVEYNDRLIKALEENHAKLLEDVHDTIADALACFRRINNNEPVPTVSVKTEGLHVSAGWSGPGSARERHGLPRPLHQMMTKPNKDSKTSLPKATVHRKGFFARLFKRTKE